MASQQSWTAWLLDAYASVVSPNPTELVSNGDKSEAASSSSSEPRTSMPSSSPYGPYVRTGRGGAGNFTWQSQQPLAQDARDDLEAQNPSTLSERRRAAAKIEHSDIGAALRSKATQKPASQYVRVGRGYVQNNEVQQTLPSASSPTSPLNTSVVSSPLIAHPGRGGAGNYAAAAEVNGNAESKKQEKDRIEAEQLRGKIEEQIQNELPAPPDAWLGGRRRSVELPKMDT